MQISALEKTKRETKRYTHDEYEDRNQRALQEKQRKKDLANKRKVKRGEE
jgi:hypothetical protein